MKKKIYLSIGVILLAFLVVASIVAIPYIKRANEYPVSFDLTPAKENSVSIANYQNKDYINSYDKHLNNHFATDKKHISEFLKIFKEMKFKETEQWGGQQWENEDFAYSCGYSSFSDDGGSYNAYINKDNLIYLEVITFNDNGNDNIQTFYEGILTKKLKLKLDRYIKSLREFNDKQNTVTVSADMSLQDITKAVIKNHLDIHLNTDTNRLFQFEKYELLDVEMLDSKKNIYAVGYLYKFTPVSASYITTTGEINPETNEIKDYQYVFIQKISDTEYKLMNIHAQYYGDVWDDF
ncbi:MAG: hypothetical protein WAX04_13805 [Oscillospiraceae bacterium]